MKRSGRIVDGSRLPPNPATTNASYLPPATGTLPLSDGNEKAAAPCVVLLEDDPLARFAQEVLLRDWGYRVVAGASRAKILPVIRNAPGDVAAIIADFHLGDDDTGAEIAQSIAAIANRKIPTLIMSASLGLRSAEAVGKYGFECMSKPVDPEQLRIWLVAATA